MIQLHGDSYYVKGPDENGYIQIPAHKKVKLMDVWAK
jgi:hypothetical protein